MMNYFLQDINDLLVLQGYDNSKIFINKRITANNLTALGESILLYDEGGSKNTGEPMEECNFSIYVRRETNEEARLVAVAIYTFLDSFVGGLSTPNAVQFRRITTRNKPTPFPTTGIDEWVILFTAQINTIDFLSIK